MVVKTSPPNLAEPTSDSGVRTLVVDDSPFMLKALSQILGEAGAFDVVGTATDGCQALRSVAMLAPELVLMDVQMPRLNGIQATRCIKQREHAPVVVLVTADESPVTKTTAAEAGADGFVIKRRNLRHHLIDLLQDLFGANGARRTKTSDAANATRRVSSKTSGNELGNFAAQERFDSGLDNFAPPATQSGKSPAEHSLWEAHSARKHGARIGSSTPSAALSQPVAATRQPLAVLCASSRFSRPHRQELKQERASTKTENP